MYQVQNPNQMFQPNMLGVSNIQTPPMAQSVATLTPTVPQLVVQAPPTQPIVQTIQQPIVQEVPKTITVPQPIIPVIPQPVVQTVPQPVVQTVPQPVVQTVPQPIVQTIPQPVVQTVPQPIVQAVPQPVLPMTTPQNISMVPQTVVANPIPKQYTPSPSYEKFIPPTPKTPFSLSNSLLQQNPAYSIMSTPNQGIKSSSLIVQPQYDTLPLF